MKGSAEKFKPGRSARLARHLAALVEITHPGDGRKMLGTVEDAAALALIARARRGSVAAIRLILDSLHGKARSA